ncbi:MAG: nucleotidyltransferase domain-containing protein [bacterium]|nr:nucleotidyltransferase domain-containing protein [bacterium]
MCATVQKIDNTIQSMVEVIVKEIDPYMVILFGSRAAGEFSIESDFDFLIVDDKTFGPSRSRRKELARVWRALGRFDAPIDLLLYSQAEFNKWRQARNHIVSRAWVEGTVVYERH